MGTIVTGVAPHSFGEAFVREYEARSKNDLVITIDKLPNKDLNTSRIQQLVLDLNPLNYETLFDEFGNSFQQVLAESLSREFSRPITTLVQCAGRYETGKFESYSVQQRRRVLGLNILGTTEVLSAVMQVNARLGYRNSECLTQVVVGSIHAFDGGRYRSLYATSKSYCLDLCVNLAAGKETFRSLFVAPGPMDTPMLHWNHWARKAGGSERVFQELLHGPRDQYRSVFVDCDYSTAKRLANEPFAQHTDFLEVIERYKAARLKASNSRFGIISPEACARQIVDVVLSGESTSGMYIPQLSGQHRIVPFSTVNRLKFLDSFLDLAKR